MPDNGKDIDKAKQKAIDDLKAKIGQMETAAYDILLKSIEDNFDFKSGKVEETKTFITQLNKLTSEVLDLLQSSPKFSGPVGLFIKRFELVSEEINAFQKEVNNIKVPDYSVTKKIVIDETIDQMLNNGLNQNFIQPLRDLIYQNFTSGLSLSDAKEQIKEFIKGGGDKTGKLSRYLEQTAQQAVDAYSGAINKKLLDQFDYDGLLITGTIIDNSSPQCKFAIEELKGKITKENWTQVKDHATKRFPLIEGTTFENLPVNKLHYGCRHSFFPIIIKKQELKKAS